MGIRTVNRTLTLFSRLVDPNKSTTPMVLTIPEKPPCNHITVAQPFERVTPESQGVDSDEIADFLCELSADPTLNMHSIMILRHGRVLAQSTFGEQDAQVWKMTFSACKSITSLAIGMLIDEGELTLSTRVVDLFPDKTTAVSRLRYKELTVKHLLTMTSGASLNEASCMTETDWEKAFFSNAPTAKPGREFRYNSLNTYMLSAIVKRVSGVGLCEYLQPRLFDPLGITEYYWETCQSGIEKGGWGLYIGTEDLAKIGQLVLNGGEWNGKRLISEKWLRTATSRHVKTEESMGDFDYGYQIWCGRTRNRFLFNGMLGQNVLAFPETGILLVSNAGNDELFQQSRYFELAEQYFGGEFPETIKEDEGAQEHLRNVIATVNGTAKEPKSKRSWWRRLFCKKKEEHKDPLPPLCYRLDGVSVVAQSTEAASVGLLPLLLQIVQNNYSAGLNKISFEVHKNTFWITYAEGENVHCFPVGFETAAESELVFRGEPYRIRAVGRAAQNEDGADVLILNVTFLETPCSRELRLYFEKDGVRLRQSERPGEPLMALFRSDLRRKLEEQPLLMGAAEKVDDDYITYRIRRVLAPEIRMKQE